MRGVRRVAGRDVSHPHHLAVELGYEHDPPRFPKRHAVHLLEIGAARRSERHACSHCLRVQAGHSWFVAWLGAADRYESSVDVVGPSGSASYDSGAHGLNPSSAPLEPSGSAGPSAGSPASFTSGSVSGGSRSVVGFGVPASPISSLLMRLSPPAPASRARRGRE